MQSRLPVVKGDDLMKFGRLPLASLSVLTLMALAAGVSAEPVPFRIDPNHSDASFTIRHFFSKVPGRFRELEGTILFDEKNVAASSVDVTIKAASIFTNNDRRDADLRSPNFFHVDSFPTITFKSAKVTPAGEGKLKVEGNLTMHGVTRPVTLDVTSLGIGEVTTSGRTSVRAGWEATTKLDRKDYGIVWNQVVDQGGMMLGDEVSIVIGIEAIKQTPAAEKKS
jgi:polyisoprenoid-binding protein YceI